MVHEMTGHFQLPAEDTCLLYVTYQFCTPATRVFSADFTKNILTL